PAGCRARGGSANDWNIILWRSRQAGSSGATSRPRLSIAAAWRTDSFQPLFSRPLKTLEAPTTDAAFAALQSASVKSAACAARFTVFKKSPPPKPNLNSSFFAQRAINPTSWRDSVDDHEVWQRLWRLNRRLPS